MDIIKTNFIELLLLLVKNQYFNRIPIEETINFKTHFFIFNLFLAVYSLLILFLKKSNYVFEIFINKHKQYRKSDVNLLNLEFIFQENRFLNDAQFLLPTKLKVYEKVSC
ncbi:hypothetical protein BW723_09285 [Polaribacter reichenbachii]|uniref:Uncharacterized protein n=1 Tax=Polaribacter reichenbachii TaxID=996801 RepID=A0A1B8U792_9FLAO|nr:hypothetical protein BW723_09285 [Polaribacter reichenbachii]AUC20342.1 hypothetical protein BTO17_17320 [Polaribacter reichenbachii]OBY67756.1 hypothetical protein LPB301_00215 [Polaribacter reichenbachii]